MERRDIRKVASGRHLLRTLTDNPALPTFIGALDTPVLKQLIDYVGVEDSGLLIEHTTSHQLAMLLDQSVWTSALPGQPDTFDPVEFLRWLEVLLEVGDAFVGERLNELDEDLLAMAFAHYLKVVDLSKKIFEVDSNKGYVAASSADSVAMFGNFEVRARQDDEWGTLSPVLEALHLENPRLLEALLTRCCAPGAFTENRTAGFAAIDAAQKHEQGREKQGYVDPVVARTFLMGGVAAALEELIDLDDYDLETQRYLTHLQRQQEDNPGYRGADDDVREGAAKDATQDETQDALDELKNAISAVVSAELMSPVALLASPQGKGAPLLHGALQRLGEVDIRAQERSRAEILYLSNALLSGWTQDGRALSEHQAAELVSATANLGLDYLSLDHATTEDVIKELCDPPGVVRLFLIGWHLLQELPQLSARRLQGLMSAVEPAASARAWMIHELVDEICAPAFLQQVRSGEFASVGDTIHLLSLIIPEIVCVQLAGLISDTPRVTERLQERRQGVGLSERAVYRYVACLDDLDMVERVFTELAEALS